MKSIELTKDHRSKLLEMCKELFPELNLEIYYDDDIADNWEEAIENNSCGNDAQVGYLISNWHKPNAKIIHWFEFCMTYLKDKILGVLKYHKTEEFLMRILFQCEAPHPIDYLYQQFKQLN